MHKAIFLEGTLRLTIEPTGPILIKAGESGGADPTLPSMEFVRTRAGGSSEDRIYIPGPSLKGVVRAQAERICRTLDSDALQASRRNARQQLDEAEWLALVARARQQARAQERPEPSEEELRRRRARPDANIPLADNPLGAGDTYEGLADLRYSSGRHLEQLRSSLESYPERTAILYRRSSFVSQIFGNTSLAGHVRFADAYPAPNTTPTIEERNGVAIDRIYGAVAVGPFNYETVVAGKFPTQINLRNLTLPQFGLLGLALRDLAEGRVGIGFGKSRGLGRVKVTFDSLDLRYPTCELAADNSLHLLGGRLIAGPGEIAGLGAFASGQAAFASYALPQPDTAVLSPIEHLAAPLMPDTELNTLPAGLSTRPDELLGVHLLAMGDKAVRDIWRACMPAWRAELGL